MSTLKRLCIYPKDIMRITGRSERYSRKLLRDVKVYFGKKPYQFISPEEFAEYSGLDKNNILEFLKGGY
ncbi:hypothetical protein [Oceanihabitans sediminis]|uniref:hypothetical protein n=1 Tax=Oceanihabitans sediminis TaxID=1812012 RepID=UPI003A9565DB